MLLFVYLLDFLLPFQFAAKNSLCHLLIYSKGLRVACFDHRFNLASPTLRRETHPSRCQATQLQKGEGDMKHSF